MGAGSIDDSLRLADRALADAEAAAHAPTMGQALAMAALLGLVRRNPEAVATYGQASADIVARYDLPGNWAAVFFQGCGKAVLRLPKSGDLAAMRRSLAIVLERGQVWLLPRIRSGAGGSRGERRRD